MKTLRDVLPREALPGGEFDGLRFQRYLDVEVLEEYSSFAHYVTPILMGFKHKNIHNWWHLKNGMAVGWNESPTRGWSFPVISLKGKR